ncbi:MAG: methylamine utilization protein [Pseudoxanthomonas sp.]
MGNATNRRQVSAAGGRALFCAVVLLACCQAAGAAVLEVSATGGGEVLADAVVSLHGAQASTATPATRASMDQRGSQFVPHVLPVQAGTSVVFPNSDQIRHQVYSFSASKRFELPLYAGTSASPIRFEQPGIVVLGCNIHDWMIGYVVVLDTPYFGKTGSNGKVQLDVPAGKYRMQVWHPRMAGAPLQQQVTLVAGKPLAIEVALDVAAEARVGPGNDRLRALQEKFRKIKPSP